MRLHRCWPLVLLLLLLGACGSIANTPSPTPTAEPTPATAPTLAVTDAPLNATPPASTPTAVSPTPTAVSSAVTTSAPTAAPASGLGRIYFLTQVGVIAQLAVVDAAGGQATVLTSVDSDIIEFAVSPDGARVALVLNAPTSLDLAVLDLASGTLTQLSDAPDSESQPAWSPDSRRLVFTTVYDYAPDACYQDCNSDLYAIDADGNGMLRLTDDLLPEHGARWSPDGAQIAFVRGCRPRVVDECPPQVVLMRPDGSEQRLAAPDLPATSDPHWLDANQLSFVSYREQQATRYSLKVADATLSEVGVAAPFDLSAGDHGALSPDGRWVALVQPNGDCSRIPCLSQIAITGIDGGQPMLLTDAEGFTDNPAWSPDGSQLVYAAGEGAERGVYVVGAEGGSSRRLADCVDLRCKPQWVAAPASAAVAEQPVPPGRLAISSTRNVEPGVFVYDIFLINSDGSGATNLSNNPANDSSPAFSPDGTQIAFRSWRTGDRQLYLMNADGSNALLLGDGLEGIDSAPSWSPDGQTIAFSKECRLYTVPVGGGPPSELLGTPPEQDACFRDPSYAPDGRSVLFAGTIDSAYSIIATLSLADQSVATLLAGEGTLAYLEPAFSPDGTQIAFVGSQEDQAYVYLMGADGSEPQRLTDRAEPEYTLAWSPDGQWIAFGTQTQPRPNVRTEIYLAPVAGGAAQPLGYAGGLELDVDWAAP